MRSGKLTLFAVFTLWIVAAVHVCAQMPGSVMLRVLEIHTPNGQGTGFTIDINGRQYLVTAKHMVAGMGTRGIVKVSKVTASNKLVEVPYTMQVFSCDPPTDIAVLVPPEQLTVDSAMDWTDTGGFGSDAFFVGFPLGMASEAKNSFALVYPLPFVKKGVVSGAKLGDDTDVFFLDGYNVFGFSGSPVLYRDESGVFKVIAVVSGFKPDLGPVLVPTLITEAQVRPEDEERGRIVRDNGTHRVYLLEETPDKKLVRLNTGIVTSYAITRAINLIKQHEVGPRVSHDFRPSAPTQR